jgi:hypothetical protein
VKQHMAILDLQGLTTPAGVKGRGGKSGASKNCNNGGGGSGLSLLLC